MLVKSRHGRSRPVLPGESPGEAGGAADEARRAEAREAVGKGRRGEGAGGAEAEADLRPLQRHRPKVLISKKGANRLRRARERCQQGRKGRKG